MCSKELYSLAIGPASYAKSYSACNVNGVRFMVESRDSRRLTQNSGVSTPGVTPGGASSMYYGVLTNIVELIYVHKCRVVLFKCKWFRTDNVGKTIRCVKKDNYTSINTSQEWCQDDQHILPTQARQIFYLDDLSKSGSWKVVNEVNHRHIWNRDIVLEHEADVIHGTVSSDTILNANLENLTITSLGNNEEPTSVEIAETDVVLIDEEDDDDDFIDDEDGDDDEGQDEYADDEDGDDIVGNDDDDDEEPDTISSDEED